MKYFFTFLFTMYQLFVYGQSAREAIEFINGKSNRGVHSIFTRPDESQEYCLIKYDGTVFHRIELLKDRETREVYASPKIMEETSHLKYMNPFNIKVTEDSRDTFWIELNTTNNASKIKVNYYGRLLAGKSIRLGPYKRYDVDLLHLTGH